MIDCVLFVPDFSRIDQAIEQLSSQVRHCLHDMSEIRHVLSQVRHHTPNTVFDNKEENISELDCKRYQQSADSRLNQIEETLTHTTTMCQQNAESIHDIRTVVRASPSGRRRSESKRCDGNDDHKDNNSSTYGIESVTAECNVNIPNVEVTQCGGEKSFSPCSHSAPGSKIRVITNSNRKYIKSFDESYAEVAAKFLPPYRQNFRHRESHRRQNGSHDDGGYRRHKPQQDCGQSYGGQTRYYGRNGQQYHCNKPRGSKTLDIKSDHSTSKQADSHRIINTIGKDQSTSDAQQGNSREQRACLPVHWRRQGSNSPVSWKNKRSDSPVYWRVKQKTNDQSLDKKSIHVVTYNDNPTGILTANNNKLGSEGSNPENETSKANEEKHKSATKPLIHPIMKNQHLVKQDQMRLYRKQIQQKPSTLITKHMKPMKAVHSQPIS